MLCQQRAYNINSNINEYVVNISKHIYESETISVTVKVGGRYDNCVNIGYSFRNNIPISAILGHTKSDPECGLLKNLEEGGGKDMTNVALHEAYKLYPSIPIFNLDDMSNIDCLETKDGHPPRRLKQPLSLPHYNISFHGKTWYEQHFNATMTDSDRYKSYRDNVKKFLESALPLFKEFINMTKMVDETKHNVIKPLYDASLTYGDLFSKIHKLDRKPRCWLLYNWNKTLVESFVGKNLATDWQIDIHTLNNKPKTGGRIKTRKSKNDYVLSLSETIYGGMSLSDV